MTSALASIVVAAVLGAAWPDLSSAPPARGGGEKDAAVIVGIEKYAAVPPVPGAAQNATDWYSFLVHSRQVPASRVFLLRNNEGAIEKVSRYVNEAAARVEPGGTLWFIFIGHGAPAKDGKDGMLVGYDAQQDVDLLYARSLPKAEVLAALNRGKQAHTVVLLDTCFSGRTSSGAELIKGLQPLLPVALASGLGRASVLTAAGADQFAGPLPGLERPAFSYLLLGAVRGWADRDADGAVTLGEAFQYTQEALMTVVRDRSQTPEFDGPGRQWVASSGSEAGPDLTAFVLQKGASHGSELSFGEAVTISVPKVAITSVSGLKDINLKAEELLEAALDLEENKAASPDRRASAWCELAAVTLNNPYATKAREGCKVWRAYGNAVRKRETALAEDYQKLAKYVQLKRKSQEQRLAAAAAFLSAYSSSDNDRVAVVGAARQGLLRNTEVALPDRSAEYKTACDAADGNACVVVGNLQLHGVWPMESDAAAARALFDKACNGGAGAGCSAIARQLERGEGVPQDLPGAAAFYERACTANDGLGCYALGALLAAGTGPTDVPRAAGMFERACDLGEAPACFDLAEMYLAGKGVAAAPATAAELHVRACETGESRGCDAAFQDFVKLGQAEQAVAFGEKACAGGRAASCLQLALYFQARQAPAAARWFKAACAAGNQSGCEQQAAVESGERKVREQSELTQAGVAADGRKGGRLRGALFLAGAAVAAALSAGGFAAAHAQEADLRAGNASDLADQEKTASLLQTFNVVGTTAAVGAACLAAVGVVSLVANREPGLALTPAVSPQSAGVLLSGRFP
jgi:TPR repeat protein